MCKNLQYYFESVYFKELHKDQSYNWPTTYGAGAAVVSTITSVNTELSSLRKPADIWRRHHLFPRQFMTCEKWAQKFHTDDASPPRSGLPFWLVEASFLPRHDQSEAYPDLGSDVSSVWNSALISQTSFRGETSGGVTKCQLFSQASN